MKPKPLTKDKLRRAIELMAIIQEEVGETQKELNNIWFGKPEGNVEKFKTEVFQIVSPLEELLNLLGIKTWKERVEWLLKEIKKEIEKQKNAKPAEFWRGHPSTKIETLEWVKNLIKKAFEGVIDD